jgi:hypothetical protein
VTRSAGAFKCRLDARRGKKPNPQAAALAADPSTDPNAAVDVMAPVDPAKVRAPGLAPDRNGRARLGFAPGLAPDRTRAGPDWCRTALARCLRGARGVAACVRARVS